jgi:PhzF family phenazine biosynthesis protein
MTPDTLYRLCAFTDDPQGGNPAGVWVGTIRPRPEEMQQIAAAVGYSETAFVTPTQGSTQGSTQGPTQNLEREVCYYSPQCEVPFCGHATIATGVVLGQLYGPGTYRLSTPVGMVPVSVSVVAGQYRAALTSVAPQQKPVPEAVLVEALAALHWQRGDLDLTIPPMLVYAGAWHLAIAVKTKAQLDQLDYDFAALKALMLEAGLLTLQLVWREHETLFHARNPFPVGGVVEDPATGAAAAALGGYLRDAQLIEVPKSLTIRQGEAMGRPSWIEVEIPASGGIVVSGQAVSVPAD